MIQLICYGTAISKAFNTRGSIVHVGLTRAMEQVKMEQVKKPGPPMVTLSRNPDIMKRYISQAAINWRMIDLRKVCPMI